MSEKNKKDEKENKKKNDPDFRPYKRETTVQHNDNSSTVINDQTIFADLLALATRAYYSNKGEEGGTLTVQYDEANPAQTSMVVNYLMNVILERFLSACEILEKDVAPISDKISEAFADELSDINKKLDFIAEMAQKNSSEIYRLSQMTRYGGATPLPLSSAISRLTAPEAESGVAFNNCRIGNVLVKSKRPIIGNTMFDHTSTNDAPGFDDDDDDDGWMPPFDEEDEDDDDECECCTGDCRHCDGYKMCGENGGGNDSSEHDDD